MLSDPAEHSTARRRSGHRTAVGAAVFIALCAVALPACGGGSTPLAPRPTSSNAAGSANSGRVEGQRAAPREPQTLTLEGEQINRVEFAESGERCATRDVIPVEARSIQRRLDRFRMSERSVEREATAPPIKVYFHVINKGPDPVNDGNVDQQQIDAQMKVMNDTYAGTHFRFVLANVDRTTNPQWYEMDVGSDEEKAAKQALGVKQKDALNIYTAHLAGRILGWAIFPWDAVFPLTPATNPYNDGVVIRFSTLPGGASTPYDQGKTMVHEAGHWLGLYHTFQGGCAAPGDYVNDTAAEDAPAFGCPAGLDTCADSQGPDPIDDFMDYTDDACMNKFTAGQSARMDALFAQYRQH